MKNTLFHLFTLILMSSCIANSQNTLTLVQDFGSNPGNLDMFKYVPQKTNSSPALVVVLHGCAQTAENIAQLTGWNKLADQHQFLLLYPQQKTANNIQKCFNWFVEDDIQKNSGEALSIKEMINKMVENHQVDPSKVFITGMSAGGAMATVMLATYPSDFQAGALMSAVPYGGATNLTDALAVMGGKMTKPAEEWAGIIKKQNPGFSGQYPRIAIFHGTDDNIVQLPNAQELTKQWSSLMNLDKKEAITQMGFEKNELVKRISFSDEEQQDLIVRYDIDGLGHAIAVDPGNGPKQGGQTDTFAKDIDFHSTYWIGKFFGVID